VTTRRDALRASGLALAALTGCSMSGSTPTATPEPPDPDVTVALSCGPDRETYDVSPAVVQVPVGGAVGWTSTSVCRQSVAAYHPDNDASRRVPEGAAAWVSPQLRGDREGVFVHTFGTPGVHDYFGLHDEFGQVGSVVVGDPDPAGQPGLSPPDDSIPEQARQRLQALNEQVRDLLDG